MSLNSILPLLITMVIVLMLGSMLFKSPKQNLQAALTEGAAWGSGFLIAFSAEILLLAHL